MRALLQPRVSTIANAIAGWMTAFALCGSSLAQTATPTRHQIQAAEDAYLAGARLLNHNDLTGAEIQFGKAAKLNPSNNDYAAAYAVIHQRHVNQLVQESGKARLLGELAHAVEAQLRRLVDGAVEQPGGREVARILQRAAQRDDAR